MNNITQVVMAAPQTRHMVLKLQHTLGHMSRAHTHTHHVNIHTEQEIRARAGVTHVVCTHTHIM